MKIVEYEEGSVYSCNSVIECKCSIWDMKTVSVWTLNIYCWFVGVLPRDTSYETQGDSLVIYNVFHSEILTLVVIIAQKENLLTSNLKGVTTPLVVSI